MSAEIQLLLSLCAPTADGSEEKHLVRAEIDWDWLLAAAATHQVTPLVYHRLSAVCPEEVPPDVLKQLRGRFLENARRSLTLTGALQKMLEELEGRGIQTMVLRGPVMSTSVYGSVALRQIADLDILVARDDVPAAAEVLAKLGYRLLEPFTPTQQALTLRTDYNFHLEREDGVAVELHWKLAPGFFAWDYDAGQWWGRAVRTLFCGRQVLAPSPEDLLVLLCVHGLKHGWDRLRQVADVAWLVEGGGLDWQEANRLAAATGVARALYLGCRLASDLLGARVPERIQRRTSADRAATILARYLVAEFRQLGGPARGYFSRSLLHLRARERWRDRMLYCFRVFFIPTVNDYAVLRLPVPLSPLYYPVRTGRMIAKYGLGPLRRAFRGGWLRASPDAGSA